jgi:hypothetical protein
MSLINYSLQNVHIYITFRGIRKYLRSGLDSKLSFTL